MSNVVIQLTPILKFTFGIDSALDVVQNGYHAPHERGIEENQHKFFYRFIPKSKRLKEISDAIISRIEEWMSNYPRKNLGHE